MHDVLILGGGWAGLWSAAALTHLHHTRDVRLIEAADHLGGRARTERHGDFHLNLGPHALYRRGAAQAALDRLDLRPTGRVPPARGGLAWVDDRLVPLPTGWLSFATTPLLMGPARWALIAALARAFRAPLGPWQGQPLSRWLDAEVPEPRARAVVEMLVRLTSYTHAPARVDAAAALAQLRLGLRGNVRYLDHGWAQVTDQLAACARAAGARLDTGVRAEALEAHGDHVVVHSSAGPLRARSVILALPPAVAARLVPGLAPQVATLEPVRAAVLDVALSRWSAAAPTLVLGLDAPLYLSVHSATAQLAPAGGAVVHVARYLSPDSRGAEVGGPAELEALLERVAPGWRAHVVTRRYLPQVPVSFALPSADGPRPSASGLPRVHLAGDWVGPEGMLADAALASAQRAVDAARADAADVSLAHAG